MCLSRKDQAIALPGIGHPVITDPVIVHRGTELAASAHATPAHLPDPLSGKTWDHSLFVRLTMCPCVVSSSQSLFVFLNTISEGPDRIGLSAGIYGDVVCSAFFTMSCSRTRYRMPPSVTVASSTPSLSITSTTRGQSPSATTVVFTEANI